MKKLETKKTWMMNQWHHKKALQEIYLNDTSIDLIRKNLMM